MSTVSENIRYLRKLKGYTQEQFAERIGIKRSLLGAYEEARANPNEIYLDSMAEILGVPVEHLLNEDLKELGRRMGPGTILKLNPGIGESNKESNKSTMEKTSSEPDQNSTRKGQMDLFTKSERSGVPNSKSDAAGNTTTPVVPDSAPDFVEVLRQLLSARNELKLFSAIEDVPVKGLSIIGERLVDVEAIRDNELYLIVTADDNLLFRRVFNQLNIKGTVILSSDFPDKLTAELSKKELKEVYHYKACIQTGAPSASLPVHKLKELTNEIAHILQGS